MIDYRTALDQQHDPQPNTKPKFVAHAVLFAVSLASSSTATPVLTHIGQWQLTGSAIATTTREAFVKRPSTSDVQCERLTEHIQKLANCSDLRDEDEPAPPPSVVEEITSILEGASRISDEGLPLGIASTFFGEISVTWKASSQVVRLACFPGAPSRVQTGNLSAPMGTYRSETATPQLLIDKLTVLFVETA